MIKLLPWLYQGNRDDIVGMGWVKKGIKSILRVSQHSRKEAVFNPCDVEFAYYLWCPFDDNGVNFTLSTYQAIVEFGRSAPRPLIVHCSAGQNRSVITSKAGLLREALPTIEEVSAVSLLRFKAECPALTRLRSWAGIVKISQGAIFVVCRS